MADGPILHESKHVILRRMTGHHQEEFTELARKSAELHDLWIYAPKTAAEFSEYLQRFDGITAECTLICRRESDEIAGFVSISEIIRGPYQRATVGYGVFAPSERQGYMTEGFDLVFRYAFRDLKLHRLEADIQPENKASLCFAEKVGFKREGFSIGLVCIKGSWKNHERWAISSDMWEKISRNEDAHLLSNAETM